MTTIMMTPEGLVRLTRVLQGGTNSVAQFVGAITKILADLIPAVSRMFLDDVGIKGPRVTETM